MPIFGPFAAGPPVTRTLSLGTAYRASNPSSAAVVSVNITSTASISLSGGTTNSADIVVGPTSGVSGGTGSVVGKYSNSNTGSLTLGLNLSTISAVPCVFDLPAGYYFAIRQTSGTVTITSAFDQTLG
jgi:hypothetical protein